MFHRDLKIKNETALKNSCRKKLKTDIRSWFPSLTDDDLETLMPKGEVKIRKILTHSGEDVTIYFGQKNPFFFEVKDRIFPTVYFLWKYPDILPVFITHPPVFDKLFNGADLMLPGVILLEEYGPKCYGTLLKGDQCAIHSTQNRAPLVIGTTALSSEDMFLSGKRGKCVYVIHCYKDKLWSMGDNSHPPSLSFVLLNDSIEDETVCDTVDGDLQINNGSIDEQKNILEELEVLRIADEPVEKETTDIFEAAENGSQDEKYQDTRTPTEQMDDLLYSCFLHALKIKVKKKDLPLLTMTFSRSCLHACCPPGQTLEIKKTSHKKLSKFLQSMQNKGFIEVKELSKGVDAITAVNFGHPELKTFICPEIDEEECIESSKEETEYEPPAISEVYMVNANTLSFFKLVKYSKGQVLDVNEIRKLLNDYIKQNELFQKDNQSMVTLDPVLSDILLNRNEILTTLRRDEIITRCLTKMQPAYTITFSGSSPEVRKGKIEPITIKVEQRTSNKKVTLIQNLEIYGIEINTFAKELQIGVAASTSISPCPGRGNFCQVMVQGNQVKYLGELLLGKYKLNKKYIQGLELASKKK